MVSIFWRHLIAFQAVMTQDGPIEFNVHIMCSIYNETFRHINSTEGTNKA